MRTFWTQAEDDMVREFYPNSTMAELKAMLGKTECAIYNRSYVLNVCKSEAYLASPAASRLKRGDNIGAEFRFKKGQEPANKGLKGVYYEGSVATFFPKGHKPANHRPAGTIREVDGYFEIKIAEGMRQWKLLHRVIWERCNGVIPKGQIVIFLDGNTKNINIKNMTLLTKAENMKRNTVHNYPKEIVQLVQLRAALNRQINKRTEHEQPRP
jgi:hypothetical protein